MVCIWHQFPITGKKERDVRGKWETCKEPLALFLICERKGNAVVGKCNFLIAKEKRNLQVTVAGQNKITLKLL